MALTLSTQDLIRLSALQGALLSPLGYPTVPEWCLACLRRAEDLFQGDRSAMLVPLLRGQLHYVSESIDQTMLARFQEALASPESGALRFHNQEEEAAWGARRAQRLDVWNIPMIARLTGRSLQALPAYHDHVKPAGITHGPVATTPVPTGEAFLGVANSGSEDAGFNGARGLELMALVLPAFKAGVQILVRLEEARGVLAQALDGLGHAILVADLSGRTLHQSRRLTQTLSTDPEGSQVLAVMQRMAAAFPGSGRFVREPAREVQTATARYAVTASYAPPGTFARDAVILVGLEKQGPTLPSVEALRARHGLSRREAEVTLLLAEGLSNKQIGERLGVSPHTVRHHAEWVFTKLGVHTRKALGLSLMAGR